MAGKYIIALDLGSQSVKTAIYDAEGRSLYACSQDTKLHTVGPGAIVYDGDEFYKQTTDNIRDVLTKSLGSPNPHNVVKAAMEGLHRLRDAKQVSGVRGIPVEKIV